MLRQVIVADITNSERVLATAKKQKKDHVLHCLDYRKSYHWVNLIISEL